MEASSKTGQDDDDSKSVKKRIALFSVMGFSIHTLVNHVVGNRTDFEIALVVTCPGPKRRRSAGHLEVVQALWDTGHHNIDVVICNKKSMYAKYMRLYKIDLIVSVGYSWLLPEDILSPNETYENSQPGGSSSSSSPPMGAINFHNSLLPQYRGPNAFGWAICNGDATLGFCAHRMDGLFDTGPVLTTRTLDYDVNDTVQEDLFPRIAELMLPMVEQVLDMALRGERGTPQTKEGISHAPKFSEDFRWLLWAESTALQAHNKIRAFYGARDIPRGALASIEGTTVCIVRSYYRDPTETGNKVEPGTVVSRSEEGKTFFVQCLDTTLEVLEWNKYEISKTAIAS